MSKLTKSQVAFYDKYKKEYDETIIKCEQLQEAIGEGGLETYGRHELEDLRFELHRLTEHAEFLAKLLRTKDNIKN